MSFRGKKLPAKEHSRRLALYEQGLSDSVIAKHCAVKKCTITTWRKNNGLKAHRGQKAKGKDQAFEAAKLFGEPKTERTYEIEEFMDKFYPGWKDMRHLWAKRTGPCTCGRCSESIVAGFAR